MRRKSLIKKGTPLGDKPPRGLRPGDLGGDAGECLQTLRTPWTSVPKNYMADVPVPKILWDFGQAFEFLPSSCPTGRKGARIRKG